jgi:hypothetical protein
MAHPEEPTQPGAVPDRVRRQLDEVFGNALPDITRDEAADAADDRRAARDEEWLHANRPPHHERG